MRSRNFRHVWCAWSAASLAQRIDGVLVGWVVLDLTDSAFLVGLISSLDSWARCSGRWRLHLLAGGAMLGMFTTLLGLAVMQRLDVWSLLLATTLGGIVWAGVQPAQQSLPADLLSGRDLVNGLALLNTAMNLTAILGPALSGGLLAGGSVGVPWAYGVLLLLSLLQLGHPSPVTPTNGGDACALAAPRRRPAL